ncbi:hypothetical protein BJY01DRAFT_204201 [Aspergillus pseudoustus]|uniref:Uncharacterized protein n=1 Tax=Aspergillus pseudoustus TaxID=1810923 RepID=A0ABR4KT59_9EURO
MPLQEGTSCLYPYVLILHILTMYYLTLGERISSPFSLHLMSWCCFLVRRLGMFAAIRM